MPGSTLMAISPEAVAVLVVVVLSGVVGVLLVAGAVADGVVDIDVAELPDSFVADRVGKLSRVASG